MNKESLINLDGVNLINELGLDKLPEADRQIFLGDMVDTIENNVWQKVLERLNPEEIQLISGIIKDSNNVDEDIINLLHLKVPDFPEIVKNEINEYKKTMLEVKNDAEKYAKTFKMEE